MSFPLTVSTDNDQDKQNVSGSDGDPNSDPGLVNFMQDLFGFGVTFRQVLIN